MKPRKDDIRINVLVQITKQILKNKALLASPVGRDPKPPIAKIVVHKKDVPFLKSQLVCVRHFVVGQNGDGSLPVIHRLRWSHGLPEPFKL